MQLAQSAILWLTLQCGGLYRQPYWSSLEVPWVICSFKCVGWCEEGSEHEDNEDKVENWLHNQPTTKNTKKSVHV